MRLALQPLAQNLDAPLYLADPDDGSGRLFIVEQCGTIRILDKEGSVKKQPFLDIQDLVSCGSERGLLSMAFHPRFAESGLLYVDYTDTDGDTVVAEYQVSASDPDRADPESAQQILFVEQPAANHNGGLLLFGPDGYLYVGLGDGGGHPENGQRTDTLLGKILRIDVDQARGGRPYGIPTDNPFMGRDGFRPEIWSPGLRNPWRFSFDRETGDLYIADVGAGSFEEIDFQPAERGGRNFGWGLLEGTECRAEAAECANPDLVPPIAEYGHEEDDCAITGGYVYRGSRYTALQGAYIFGDYCSGRIWAFDASEAPSGNVSFSELLDTDLSIASFAEDAAGELYLLDLGGEVYRVMAQ